MALQFRPGGRRLGRSPPRCLLRTRVCLQPPDLFRLVLSLGNFPVVVVLMGIMVVLRVWIVLNLMGKVLGLGREKASNI
uniref:Uncharacterized protein n=1 Tax=Oryza glumipatula TaxID=40148 RepID=A0A0E0BJ09_9ORYZ